jgi:hypothetical protein
MLYGLLPQDELLLNAIRLRQNKLPVPPVAAPSDVSAFQSPEHMFQQMLILRRGAQSAQPQPTHNTASEYGQLDFPSISDFLLKVFSLTVSQPDCAICLEALYNGFSEVMALEPCNHVFHSLCIRKWLEEKRECPFCRCVAYFTLLAVIRTSSLLAENTLSLTKTSLPCPKWIVCFTAMSKC